MKKKILAIDIAKHNHYICDEQGEVSEEITNDKKGFRRILHLVKKHGFELVVMEATGGYERQVLLHLAEKNVPVALVEASRVRSHARSAGVYAKTDKLDAKVIAHFASCHPPRLYKLQSKTILQLRELNHRLYQITKMMSQEKTRIDKIDDAYLERSITRCLRYFQKEKDRLIAKMDKLWEKEAALIEKSRCLQSCPGIGKITARTILLECPELGTLTGKEVGSLAGLAPMNHDSGAYRGQKKIRGGRRRLRHCLYMAAVASIRCNPVISAFYYRLREKKKGKVAITACMRKMLVCFNAMIRQKSDWVAKAGG